MDILKKKGEGVNIIPRKKLLTEGTPVDGRKSQPLHSLTVGRRRVALVLRQAIAGVESVQ